MVHDYYWIVYIWKLLSWKSIHIQWAAIKWWLLFVCVDIRSLYNRWDAFWASLWHTLCVSEIAISFLMKAPQILTLNIFKKNCVTLSLSIWGSGNLHEFVLMMIKTVHLIINCNQKQTGLVNTKSMAMTFYYFSPAVLKLGIDFYDCLLIAGQTVKM